MDSNGSHCHLLIVSLLGFIPHALDGGGVAIDAPHEIMAQDVRMIVDAVPENLVGSGVGVVDWQVTPSTACPLAHQMTAGLGEPGQVAEKVFFRKLHGSLIPSSHKEIRVFYGKIDRASCEAVGVGFA
jgi:hypothetical protein